MHAHGQLLLDHGIFFSGTCSTLPFVKVMLNRELDCSKQVDHVAMSFRLAQACLPATATPSESFLAWK